ncbi:bacillithiol biosynthesis cysteine-adding enzyme BshC [Flavobacterium terrigena]|uniref:Putative cysteine ligase BshC n=1 Tax=Flavobacterium terrigena TaxID=402734 RepID=A0A1H6U5J7_9FLAO|nr:bacillithiol biosynthesis cysteine-adding enzyme BshC [Flavobacterium terrigena]SEI87583.1 bacillithiol biosynthesis cysteine-adding enzyme BshC [Flavobacterium terrigena]
MPTDCITYQKSGYFSKLIVDYLDEKPEIQSLYHRFPALENFAAQIDEKAINYSLENRQILAEALKNQNANFPISELTQANIELLKSEKTFTITTGHQLNLFTGPAYFIYKIASVINLCKQLKEKYSEYNFVPVYWMATEDHDFEEINHFNFKDKKITWKKDSLGPVGRLSTEGLDKIYKAFSDTIGVGSTAEYLKELFQKSYLEHSNLADATRFLANELFSEEGLIIIDGDDSNLKTLFTPYIKDELLHQNSFEEVSKTIQHLKDYAVQVNPREINLFYIEDHLRERIVFENNLYKVNNTKIAFSESEILEVLKNSPEKFSPNVILRPLYQEVILPNLAYIGGAGEIAYWLELKSNFNAQKVTFPMLIVRNSFVVVTEKQLDKIDKLEITWADLFLPQQELFNKKTKEFSNFKIDFSEQKETLKKQFSELLKIAEQTDKSFLGAVKAQEAKQTKGLENLEKRLLKAEKRVHADKLERIFDIQNQLFTNGSLQERKSNFSEFYSKEFINNIILLSNPLKTHFKIVKI